MLKWKEGRQGSGYYKLPLILGSSYDLYLLKFPPGSFIEPHTDPVPNKKHYRANFEILKAMGGSFQLLNDEKAFKLWRLTVFRPDEQLHQVTKVIKGTRYVLSFGFVK